jgi:hypothetical protein
VGPPDILGGNGATVEDHSFAADLGERQLAEILGMTRLARGLILLIAATRLASAALCGAHCYSAVLIDLNHLGVCSRRGGVGSRTVGGAR